MSVPNSTDGAGTGDQGGYRISSEVYDAFGIDRDPITSGPILRVDGKFSCWLCDRSFLKKCDLTRHCGDIHWVDLKGEHLEGHRCPDSSCKRHGDPFARLANLKAHLRSSRHGYTDEEIEVLINTTYTSQAPRSVAEAVATNATSPVQDLAASGALPWDESEMPGIHFAWLDPIAEQPGPSRKRKRGDPNSGLRSRTPRSTASDTCLPNMTDALMGPDQPAIAKALHDAISSRTRSHNVVDCNYDEELAALEVQLGNLHSQRNEGIERRKRLEEELAKQESRIKELEDLKEKDKQLVKQIGEGRTAIQRLRRRYGPRSHRSSRSTSSMAHEDVVGS